MTLLEELQAKIRISSNACGRPFPLGASALPFDAVLLEESAFPPLGLSSKEPFSQLKGSASKGSICVARRAGI